MNYIEKNNRRVERALRLIDRGEKTPFDFPAVSVKYWSQWPGWDHCPKWGEWRSDKMVVSVDTLNHGRVHGLTIYPRLGGRRA